MDHAITKCGKEHTTLLVCAGVEGAGKTSACGVLKEMYGDVLETAFTPGDIEHICQAHQEGYYIRLFYIGLNTLEDHLIRIQNRVQKGGESVDPVEVKRQFQTRFVDLKMVLPYCNEIEFMDNTNGFCGVAKMQGTELAIAENGRNCLWLQEWLSIWRGEKT